VFLSYRNIEQLILTHFSTKESYNRDASYVNNKFTIPRDHLAHWNSTFRGNCYVERFL